MTTIKRFNIDIETTYGRGIYDGDVYSDLRVRENAEGDWVKAADVLAELQRMKNKIKRMQVRLDKQRIGK